MKFKYFLYGLRSGTRRGVGRIQNRTVEGPPNAKLTWKHISQSSMLAVVARCFISTRTTPAYYFKTYAVRKRLCAMAEHSL